MAKPVLVEDNQESRGFMLMCGLGQSSEAELGSKCFFGEPHHIQTIIAVTQER